MIPVIHRFESVSSTNDVAIRMAEDGAPEGTVVVALEQTAGRGRHGRRWSSSPGGLYLSTVLRPGLPIERHQEMAYVASLAACEAVRHVSGLDARIKWPNDVLIGGRKVCGILVEARGGVWGCGSTGVREQETSNPRSASGDASHDPPSETAAPMIVGIGVNVNNEAFPPEIAETATSIALEVGHPIALNEVEEALLSALGARYEQLIGEGFEPVLQAWTRMREGSCDEV